MSLDAYGPLVEIGRGGFGFVLRGRSPDGRDVAIKVLHRVGSRKYLARFDREKRLLRELGAEAGFVPLLDSGDSPQGPYFVMPFVGGGTLRDRLRRGPLSVKETVALGTKLARALGHAHAAGIVHRDLKPDNVLFTHPGAGEPLIADLGLAKHFKHDDPDAKSVSLSNAGTALGTLGYMAPEQMRNAKAAGPEVDVFSLGTILHECLTGQRVFRASNVLELVRLVEGGVHEKLPEHVPAWLVAVIERAIEVHADERFPDGAALAAAFERGSGEGASRTRALVAAVVAGLVVLAGLGGAAVRAARAKAGPGATDGPAAVVSSSGGAAPVESASGAETSGQDFLGEKPGKKERALLEQARSAEAASKRKEAYVAYMELGGRALSKEHPRLACHAYQAAVDNAETQRERLAALSDLSYAEMHLGSVESACAHLKSAVAISPDDALLRNNLAYALHLLAHDAEALEEYRRCLELDPDRNLARMSMGILARTAGDPKEALKAHRALLRPASLGMLDLGGAWFFRFESAASKAKGQGVSFASEKERSALVRLEIALDRAFLDDLEGAEKAIREAADQAFDAADLKPAIDKTLDDIRRALELEPRRYALRFVAGILHSLEGDKEAARAELHAFRVKEAAHGGRLAERALELLDALK